MRRKQVGVMGSMADVGLKKSLRQIAGDLGKEIAGRGAVLVYGYEGDFDSLSEIAARSAEKHGGETLAFLWGSNRDMADDLKSIRVSTGQVRGGGRELSLVLSCDVLICISGGSGTLTEIAMAYQANIPVIVIGGTGGWSDKLADKFLDARKRFKVIAVKDAKQALEKAFGLAEDGLSVKINDERKAY